MFFLSFFPSLEDYGRFSLWGIVGTSSLHTLGWGLHKKMRGDWRGGGGWRSNPIRPRQGCMEADNARTANWEDKVEACGLVGRARIYFWHTNFDFEEK